MITSITITTISTAMTIMVRPITATSTRTIMGMPMTTTIMRGTTIARS